jgi:DNA-binding beta-propeller fold protein YncE
MVLAGLSIAAVPSLALGRTAYFTGATDSTPIAAPIDLTTRTVGGHTTFSGIEGAPSDVAITPDGKTAYVVSPSFPSYVKPIDVATNVAGANIPIAAIANSIAIAPDGRFAYVTSAFGSANAVSKIDLSTSSVTEISVGIEPLGIAITPDGKTAYVVCRGENAVFPIDLASGTVGAAIPLPPMSFPTSVAITPDGKTAYVAAPANEELARIDLATNTVGTVPNAPGFELAIAPNGAKAYVVNSPDVTAVNLSTGTAGQITSSNSSNLEDVAILPDGSHAYLTGFEQGSPFKALMTPLVTTTDTLEAPFSLNASFAGAIAIVPNQPPHAAFSSSPSSPTPGSVVSFNAGGSTDSDGSVVRYDWNFGDGSSAANAGPTPSHTFAKGGTYQVTVTETDNEGCSVSLVFTGQTAYCNGSSVARATHPVTVGGCPKVVGGATSFVPKLRSSHVVPGVRVRLAVNAPAHLVVKSTLLWSREGHEGRAGLGRISVDVKHWRRIRLPIPAELRSSLPLGSKVRVNLEINAKPRDGSTCLGSISRPTLHVRVVKVIPQAVQFGRPR